MDTRVKPAHDGLTRVNPSLTLFAKFVSVGATLYRGFAADVVISASPLVECGVMRNIMIFAAFIAGLGASVVALNETSAARFGLRPSRGDYNATVATANGTIKAARTRLALVDIGGLVVRDVDAMVLPDEALSENLLGLSFLSRLKRFEYANGQMVLEQ